jgi:hypothetical protein
LFKKFLIIYDEELSLILNIRKHFGTGSLSMMMMMMMMIIIIMDPFPSTGPVIVVRSF